MRKKGLFTLVGVTALAVLAALAPVSAVADDSMESMREREKALEAERNPALRGDQPVTFPAGAPYPLFVGVDDATLPSSAYLVDPATNTNIPAFGGAEVWGAAYDPDNDKVYFTDGSVLNEWVVGAPTTTMLGTIVNSVTGGSMSTVGLAFYGGVLYGSSASVEEGIYSIDPGTLVATLFIDYDNTTLDCGGLAADPNTGEFYCTSDDSDTRGLNRINPDGTATFITAYPAGETDIDGLAVSDDGFAYLIEDEAGDTIHVWDFGAGAYAPSLTSPFTTSEVFSGGAYLYTLDGPDLELVKTVGTSSGVCGPTNQITVPLSADVYYCYTATNTGTVSLDIHTLVDDQLGTLFMDLVNPLAPGADFEVITSAVTINAPVVNNATWTASVGAAGYTHDDTANYMFVDISATGTGLGLSDDGEIGVTMPFPFTLYGVTSTDVCVGNNGGLIFDATTCSLSAGNSSLPSSSVPLGILPFWDDIDSDTGDVYYETVGTSPNQQFIVQWHMRPHFSNIGDATFQVILFEGSNNILFQYADTVFGDPLYDFGASATIGLNMDGSTAHQYSFNTAGPLDGLAILWTPTGGMASDSDSAEVLLEDPDIDVTPTSLMASQMTNTVTMQTLNIGNVGGNILNWTLEEDPDASEHFPPFGQPNPANLMATREIVGTEIAKQDDPPWSPHPQIWDAPQIVLYDNGPLVNCAGCGSGGADESQVQSGLGMTVWGFGHQFPDNRVADDFTVPAGGWYIDTITFFAYQTGSTTTSTMTGVNLQIWDGSPDNPGSTVVWGDTTTNVMAATGWTNIYRVTDTATGNTDRPIMANAVTLGIILPPGTYWLDWQSDGSLASGPWAPPITINGQTTTGNALQWTTSGGAWAALEDSGSLTPQGLPFIIEGDVDPPPCAAPADIPWLSLSPTSGTTAPAGSDPIDVTFDSTGIPVGTLGGTICVVSDDPDEPIVPVPVTLEVVIPVELQTFTIE